MDLLSPPLPWFLPIFCRLCSYCWTLFSCVHHRCGRRCPSGRRHWEGEEQSLRNSMGSDGGSMLPLFLRFVNSLWYEHSAGRLAGKWWNIEESSVHLQQPLLRIYFESFIRVWILFPDLSILCTLSSENVFHGWCCVCERWLRLTRGIVPFSKGRVSSATRLQTLPSPKSFPSWT